MVYVLLVLENSQLSGCGFKPRRCILNGVCEASYYIGKKSKGSQKKNLKQR
jgi:hypothetical protein